MSMDPDAEINRWEPLRCHIDLYRVHLFDLESGNALD